MSIRIEKRRSAFKRVPGLNESDFIEVTQWSNCEGFDVTTCRGDQMFSLSFEEYSTLISLTDVLFPEEGREEYSDYTLEGLKTLLASTHDLVAELRAENLKRMYDGKPPDPLYVESVNKESDILQELYKRKNEN